MLEHRCPLCYEFHVAKSMHCTTCRGPRQIKYKGKQWWYRDLYKKHYYLCRWMVRNAHTYRMRKWPTGRVFAHWLQDRLGMVPY